MNFSQQEGRVLDQIFGHPFPHNLEWSEVVTLVARLGDVLERHDGKYEFRIASASAVFTKPRHKDVGVDEVAELRRFLTEAGVRPAGTPESSGEAAGAPASLTVVLVDHHGARFFEPASGRHRFEERTHLEPTDPRGYERHLEHRKEADFKGQRTPEAAEFYDRVADRLKSASAIVLVGDATGKSSAMQYLFEYLEEKHQDIASRVRASVEADLSSIGLEEIERIASSSR
jgi:hypothetical protein